MRFAEQQERMIGPDGTYPPVGRSIAYRLGAFHALAQVSLMKKLPKEIKTGTGALCFDKSNETTNS